MTTTPVLIEGTPLEVGAEVFSRLCMPALGAATTKLGATPTQLTQLYCGFLQGCLGAMAADFGQQQAAEVAQLMVDTFKHADLGIKAATH